MPEKYQKNTKKIPEKIPKKCVFTQTKEERLRTMIEGQKAIFEERKAIGIESGRDKTKHIRPTEGVELVHALRLQHATKPTTTSRC